MSGSRVLAVLAVLCIGPPALACSGPQAGKAMARAELLGWRLWAASWVVAALCGLLLLGLRPAKLPRLGWLAGLLFIHPGWWLDARGGDCGVTLVTGSLLVTALTAAAAALALLLPGRRRPPEGAWVPPSPWPPYLPGPEILKRWNSPDEGGSANTPSQNFRGNSTSGGRGG
jgi:hypothetical protein